MSNGLLSLLSHAELQRMRDEAAPEAQGMLAPYEHRAFAREATAENPLMALSLAAGIPAYQLAKLLGLTQSRSAPSLDQITQGYVGIGEGLLGKFR